MTKELIDRTWACLPREFKEEVKKEWRHTDSNTAKWTLEYLFGKYNLTSDAEGEEMLMCEKSKVQKVYNTSREIVKAENPDSLMYSIHTQIMCVLESIFGSKCLLDAHEDNFATKKPQPAEPKEKSSNSTELKSQEVDKHFDAIIKDGFREHNRLHIAAMAMAGILSYGDLADPDEVTDMAIIYADELIEKCEKGKGDV